MCLGLKEPARSSETVRSLIVSVPSVCGNLENLITLLRPISPADCHPIQTTHNSLQPSSACPLPPSTESKTERRQCSRDGWGDWQRMPRERSAPSVCTFRHVFTFPLFPPCPNYFYFEMLRPTKHRATADRSAVK